MLYLITVLISASAFCLAAGLGSLLERDRLVVVARLMELQQKKSGNRLREELSQPLTLRVLKPVWDRLSGNIVRSMPVARRRYLQRRLQSAGVPVWLTPGGFRLIQLLLSGLAGGLAAATGLLSQEGWINLALLLVVGALAGILLPELYLGSRIKGRRQEIERSLPDVLDLLMVSVEAGLGFELALVKVTEKFRGALSGEFGRLLQELRLGKPRREAFRDLAERVGVDDLTSFIGSLVQAEQLGVNIGSMLRLQAEQMRRKRRQRAEEQAMKAPVKMLLPLVFCIFPALFVVLLGPAILQIMKTL